MSLLVGGSLFLLTASAHRVARHVVEQRNDDASEGAFLATTRLGCKCVSACQLDDRDCNTQFWCNVDSDWCPKGEPFKGFLQGTWDYCILNTPASVYEDTADVKFANLRQQIKGNIGLTEFEGSLDILFGVNKQSMVTTTSLLADTYTYPRTKYVRPVGVTAGARFVSTGGHSYTGIFKGSEHVIVRLSLSQPPKEKYAPGISLKFLRDNKPSGNVFGFVDFEGQPCSEPFFKYTMYNHVPAATGLSALVPKKFLTATLCTQMVGISDLADEDGVEANFPYQLGFQGIPEVDFPCDETGAQGFANLGAIPPGSKLIKVIAQSAPKAGWEHIGDIFLVDSLVNSVFADDQLFFKHQPMEEDLQRRPEWFEQMDKFEECGSGHVQFWTPAPEDGCDSKELDKP